MNSEFEQEVRDLERRHADRLRQDDILLFYGSSSLRLWDGIEKYFPSYNVINRGFGGSTLADCLDYFDRLVLSMKPKTIVLYAGDNDLDNGTSPEAVLGMVQEFVRRKRQHFGAIPMAFVSIKLSPARFHIRYKISYTNYLIAHYIETQDDVDFVDIFAPMSELGIDDFRHYYSEDNLHMNQEGYKLWAAALSHFLADHHGPGVQPLEYRPQDATHHASRSIADVRGPTG